MNPSKRSTAVSVFECSAALLILALLLWVLRHPTASLGLAYYDDGETLYHALSLLLGKIPYRDDYSHHFLGYALPFVLGAKIFGFSLDLIREVGFVVLLTTGLGVYLVLRLFTHFWYALLGASVAISIREPWVLSFFPQYEINWFTIYVLYFSLLFCLRRRASFIASAGFLCGAAFCFDQRALLLLLIPAVTILLTALEQPAQARKSVPALFLGWLVLPALALAYLSRQAVLGEFWYQTFVFPQRFRIASVGTLDLFVIGVRNHAQLLGDAPIAVATAAIGFLGLVRRRRSWAVMYHQSPRDYTLAYSVLLAAALPLAIMPFFGGRTFPYYVITWFPYLGILSALSARFFLRLTGPLAAVVRSAPLVGVVVSLVSAVVYWNGITEQPYHGDGRAETVQFLRENLSDEDSLYVWGYRLDIYAELTELAAYPMANRMFVHPDQLVLSDSARLQHIDPKYQQLFFSWLDTNPPTYMVTFERSGTDRNFSPSQDKVQGLLSSAYKLVFETNGVDFLGGKTTFRVFHRLDTELSSREVSQSERRALLAAPVTRKVGA